MKKIFDSFILSTLVLCSACSSGAGNGSVTSLDNAGDSMEYATAMYLSRTLPRIIESLGVEKENIGYFIEGVRTAFPATGTPAEVARAYGMYIGANAIDMMKQADEILYPDDTLKSINRTLFLDAMLSVISGKEDVMTTTDAVSYYNMQRYRSKSDRFMQMNATRPGVEQLENGLQYKVDVMGTGKVAAASDTVRCIYKSYFTDGNTFDSSRGSAARFAVSDVIPGFSQALQFFPEGTKCKIYIPWQLAYGAAGTKRIPPYSVLVFDMEIIQVIKKK